MIPERALSLWQPWATLVVTPRLDDPTLPVKDIENRGWWTSYRGPTMIHAGKSRGGLTPDVNSLIVGIAKRLDQDAEYYQVLEHLRQCWEGLVPFGAFIGQVDIVDCVRESDSEWFQGQWGFVLRNPILYKRSFESPGRQKFFHVQPGWRADIDRHLRALD